MLNAPPDVIEACQKKGQEKVVEVWKENWSSVEAFVSLSTSWNTVSNGVGVFFSGLPSTEILATLQLLGLSKSKQKKVFMDLREMERAALNILNE